MSQPQVRKYYAYERSVPKDTSQHYQNTSPYTAFDKTQQLPERKPKIPQFSRTSVFPKFNFVAQSKQFNEEPWNAQIQRTGSQHQLKFNEDIKLQGKYIRKKNDGVVHTLKSQLQNLKFEVNKLIHKQEQTLALQRSNSKEELNQTRYQQQKSSYKIISPDREKDDNLSVTSEKIINQPLRQLSKMSTATTYDHAHYMELQNQLLKTQLRNLKNKYNSKKAELSEKCQCLEKKNQYLEITLRRTQQSLSQYKLALDTQIQSIKAQLSKKYQVQQQINQKKYDELPQKDVNNEVIHQKLKNLYQQLSQKNKTINTFTIQINQIKTQKERLMFEVRKQKQLNGQLFKQIQFTKRQLSRNQQYLEAQMSKNNQLKKSNQMMKQNNFNLIKQLDLKNRQVTGSQQYQNRVSRDLDYHKQKQIQLKNQVYELQNKVKKLSQIVEADKIQIQHLKKDNESSMKQVQNISKSLRNQKEKFYEAQQKHRKMLEEAKKKEQERINIIKSEYQALEHNGIDIIKQLPKSQNQVGQANQLIKEKDRLISKWKAQYKLIKAKLIEKQKLQEQKKNQNDSYYQGYIEYKHRVQQLDMKNQGLNNQLEIAIQKIKKLQIQLIGTKSKLKRQCKHYQTQYINSSKQLKDLKQQQTLLKKKLQQQIQNRQQQINYRKNIQQKIFQIKSNGSQEINGLLDKLQKRLNEQDQKHNKIIKQIKNKDILISKLRKQIRELIQQKQNQLIKIKQKQIEQVTKQLLQKKFSFIEEIKITSRRDVETEKQKYNKISEQNSHIKGKINSLQNQLAKLKQENQTLQHLYNDKLSDYSSNIEKFNKQKQLYQQRLSQARMDKLQLQNSITNQIKAKNQQIYLLRQQLRKINQQFSRKKDVRKFDDALKDQIEVIEKLRDQLSKKTQELYKSKDSYTSIRSNYDNLKSEVQIIKLKALSQKKNMQVNYQVEIQNLKNKIAMEEKKIISMDQKIQIVMQQNKKKDNFIQTYIMGKKLPQNDKEFIMQFVKKYEILMSGSNINKRLQQESQQLEKLTTSNYNLLKQLAELKQKMVIYQATSPERSENLSKSVQSFQQFQKSPKSNRRLIAKDSL